MRPSIVVGMDLWLDDPYPRIRDLAYLLFLEALLDGEWVERWARKRGKLDALREWRKVARTVIRASSPAAAQPPIWRPSARRREPARAKTRHVWILSTPCYGIWQARPLGRERHLRGGFDRRISGPRGGHAGNTLMCKDV